MDKDYLNFLERMGSFGMELGDQSDEIQHHGVKGQRWGVRKRVTSVRKRVTSAIDSKKAVAKSDNEARAKYSSTYAKRSKMSDADLKKSVERLELENRLGRAVSSIPTSAKSKGALEVAKYSAKVINSKPVISALGGGLVLAVKKYGPGVVQKVKNL